MSNEASREAFDAWANGHGMDASAWGDYPDVFKFKSTNDAWNGWQASRKALEAEQAQQVAVPVGIPHIGADEMPPIFGRRWRLARDGFGLQRDDESGNYVHIDDAISTMHAMLAAAPQGDTP